MKDYNIKALCPVSIFKSCVITFPLSGIFVGFALYVAGLILPESLLFDLPLVKSLVAGFVVGGIVGAGVGLASLLYNPVTKLTGGIKFKMREVLEEAKGRNRAES